MISDISPLLVGEDGFGLLNIIIGISNILCGSLFIALALPLLNDSVSMNRFYGVRFKKSFESEGNWYAINRYTAKWLIGCSLAMILLGFATFLLPLSLNDTWVILLALAPALFLIPVVLAGYLFAKRL